MLYLETIYYFDKITGYGRTLFRSSEFMSYPDIWFDGAFIPWDKAGIHPLCHSLQRGSTIFESIDCNGCHNEGRAIFRLRDHMERFVKSADIIGMKLQYTVDELNDAVTATVAHSGMTDCTIRPLGFYSDPVFDVFPGDSHVSVIVALGPPSNPPVDLRVAIAGLRKIDSGSMPVKAKVSGNYINPVISKSEAVSRGFDDAILLDKDGYVAEGTTANVFIVSGGKLITAPSDRILLGITRDTIISLADHLGIEVIFEKFGKDRLLSADEVILCSSGKDIAPVVRVENSDIGAGKPGPDRDSITHTV